MHSLKRILPVYFIVFLGYIGYSLFLTIFAPLFLKSDVFAQTMQSRVVLLGILIFLYPFGQFLSSPILGALSDRFGRRPIFLYSLAVTACVYVTIGLSLIYGKLWLLYSALLVAGLSEGNITIAQSAIADISKKGERVRLFGYIYFSAACSYVVGPVLGGWLANVRLWNGLSYELPFFLVAALMVSAWIWTWRVFEETLHKTTPVSYWEGITNVKNLFVMRHLRFPFSINFLIYMACFGFLQGFPIFLVSRFNVGVGPLSLMVTWTDIPFLVINLFFIGWIGQRFELRKALLVGVAALVCVLAVMLLPKHIGWMWLLLPCAGVCVAVLLPLSSTWISVQAAEGEQGRVMGVNQSLNFLTEAIAGLGFGLLAAAYVKLALAFFALMGLLAALMLLFCLFRARLR